MNLSFANEIEKYGMEIDIIREGGDLQLVGGKPTYTEADIVKTRVLITNANKGSKEEWGMIQNADLSDNTILKVRSSKVRPILMPNDRFYFFGEEYRIMYERKLQSNFCDFRIYFATRLEVDR